MTTLSDLINETLRLLQPDQRERTLVLSQSASAGAQTLFFNTLNPSGSSVSSIRPGHQLAIDLELFYVSSVNTGSNSAQVIPGWRGSTPASHTANTTVFVEPKFSAFDIAVAINHDLFSLSASGIYQMKTLDLTWNPIVRGYDLGVPSSSVLDIYDLEFKTPDPSHYFPHIKRWKLLRNMTDSSFPSGCALMIYGGAFPGLPVHVWYKSPFNPLVFMTDDAVSTAGLPTTAVDLPALGAALRLVPGREVRRNFDDVQADPRRAEEIPPGAVMNSVAGLKQIRDMRIAEEAGRLDLAYPKIRPGRR